MVQGRFFIGTSGWSYDHWSGVFYPPELKTAEWLTFYIRCFNSVEINNTFYHLPSANAFKGWKKAAPEKFIYALKASRFITHMKKLKDSQKPLNLFLKRASILGEHLGSVLFQLPPHWKCNPERLSEFIKLLPDKIRFAFEFREQSWFNDEVYDILTKGNHALCIYHMPDFQSPVVVTASFAYIRFHGTDSLYGGRYSKKELSRWADIMKGFIKNGLDVYAYFNNDAYGYAVMNARELMEILA